MFAITKRVPTFRGFSVVLEKSDRPPGGGWQPIPMGKKGGYRKRVGREWVYWYPGEHHTSPHAYDHVEEKSSLSVQEVTGAARALQHEAAARRQHAQTAEGIIDYGWEDQWKDVSESPKFIVKFLRKRGDLPRELAELPDEKLVEMLEERAREDSGGLPDYEQNAMPGYGWMHNENGRVEGKGWTRGEEAVVHFVGVFTNESRTIPFIRDPESFKTAPDMLQSTNKIDRNDEEVTEAERQTGGKTSPMALMNGRMVGGLNYFDFQKLHDLANILGRMKLEEPTKVYRGVVLPTSLVESLQPGDELDLRNISSWSKNSSTADYFIEMMSGTRGLTEDHTGVNLEMVSDRGFDISDLSPYPEQEEVLIGGKVVVESLGEMEDEHLVGISRRAVKVRLVPDEGQIVQKSNVLLQQWLDFNLDHGLPVPKQESRQAVQESIKSLSGVIASFGVRSGCFEYLCLGSKTF